jgi:beta-lactamase class A
MKRTSHVKKAIIAFVALILATGCINSKQMSQITANSSLSEQSIHNQPTGILPDTFLNNLLAKYPQLFNEILTKKEELGLQIIYTQIDRGKKEKHKTKFTDYTFNLNTGNYFYPASTVKLPIAILALQKLNELKINGLNRNTTMITESAGGSQTVVNNDPSAVDGRPTIAHYIKKILLVSDNDAFNRLYEFLGQEYINSTLHKMGYTDVQIIHRLSVSLTEEENRLTNPVLFTDSNGRIVFRKPLEKSKLVYAERNTKMGKGYMRGSELVNEPFDFSKKNLLPLKDLHNMVRSIFFPEDFPKEQRFNLTKEDYEFLRLYMSMHPSESKSPLYAAPEYWDNYVKMIYYGSEKTNPEPGIRIFNKTGTAYGFLIESCYFADFNYKIEFLLSAVIYCNSDGIFNDDKYDYNTIGYPFFKNLGKVIHEYERTRVRKYKPDLSSLFYNYTN